MGYMDNMQLSTMANPVASAGAAGAFNPALALGGAALEIGATAYGNRLANKRQHEQFDQIQAMYGKRYQMQVADLKAAGLNPMLAYSQGAPAVASAGQAQTKSPDMVNAMSNAMVASAQAGKLRQETLNLQMENINTQETGTNLLYLRGKLAAEIDAIDAEIKLKGASTAETERRTKLIEAQTLLTEITKKLSAQELKIKFPQEMASGTEGAKIGAYINATLDPLIKALSGMGMTLPKK